MKTDKFVIPSLDGIRALAFLVVFIAHSGAKSFIPGGFGVTVFFFLSGYLITTLLRREFDKDRKIKIKIFFIKRFLRIFPPFLFAIVLGIGLTYIGLLDRSIAFIDVLFQIFQLSNYSYLMGYTNIPLGTGIYWSLAVEEHFYFIFPFIFLFCYGRFTKNKFVLFLSLIALVTLLLRFFFAFTLEDFEDRIYKATDTRIDSILYGCIMAIGFNPMLDKNIIREGYWWKLSFVGIGLIVITFTFKNIFLRETIRYSLQGLGLMPLFYCAIKYSDWWVFKIFNNKILKHLGVLSYSLYLIHFMVLYVVHVFIPHHVIVSAIVAFLVTFGIGQLMHWMIEQPLLKLRSKLLTI